MLSSRIWCVPLGMALSSCATVSADNFPTYRYQGIDLLAGISGILEFDGSCYRLSTTSPPGRNPILIFPSGTQLRDETFYIPPVNGGQKISVGQRLEIQGGFDTLEGSAGYISNPTECSGSAFIVNKVVSQE